MAKRQTTTGAEKPQCEKTHQGVTEPERGGKPLKACMGGDAAKEIKRKEESCRKLWRGMEVSKGGRAALRHLGLGEGSCNLSFHF